MTIEEQKAQAKKEKETLVKAGADLKAAGAEYREKFESLLQAQQEALDKAADLF